MRRYLLILMAALATLIATPSLAQSRPAVDREAQRREEALQDQRIQEAIDRYEAEREALREQHADEIKAHDDAVDAFRKANPSPAGTTETMIATSYGENQLPEGTQLTYFNRWNVPTHKVDLGPDGQPTGAITQTQQGKAWETIGPRIPPGGGAAILYGEDFDGNEIMRNVRIFDKDGWVIAEYDFNFDGVAWQGETFDPETGKRNGGFQDLRFKPPVATFGGPLPVPTALRYITGVCTKCRPLADQHNDLAYEINRRIAEMKSLSEQHQRAYPPGQRPIRMRHDVLQAEVAALMPGFEALREQVYTCERGCRPPAEPATEPVTAMNSPTGEPITPPVGPAALQTAYDPTVPVTPTRDAYVAGDADLEQAAIALQAYLDAANCEGMECPTCDCAEAKAALQALYDLETYLRDMGPYLQAAQADHFAQLKAQADAGTINAEQQRKTILAVGVHQGLHDFGSLLLDIASVMSWAKEIATSEKSLDQLSPVEMLDRLNGLYEAMKDLESAANTAAASQTGEDQKSSVADVVEIAPGVDKDFINDTTSTISDIKSIVQAGIENGSDWRKALKDGGALAALGQIGGRYLKAYSAKKLEERKQALSELERDAKASGLAQNSAFVEWQKAAMRRWTAEDLLAQVRIAQRVYGACVYRACGPFTISRPAIPTFKTDVPGAGTKPNWGQALRWFNGAIAQTLPRLKPVSFKDDCPPKEEEDPRAQPDQPATALTTPQTAYGPLPPGAVRPQFERVDLNLPASFCSEFERVDFLNEVYNPAAAAALANASAARDYSARLNGLFTEYMRNEGGPIWASIQREMAEWEPIADAAQKNAEDMPALYDRILAIPIVDCPQTAQNDTIPSTGQPLTAVDDKPAKPGKPDCPPEERRRPITVGPNSKVGSGARLKAKAASTALGIAGGLLGNAAGLPSGGGGGGSGGPPTVVCKITDKEMTVFNDPASGVSLKVGAKRAGGTVVVFADIAKSPDNGTFQTGFLENPQGEAMAPADVGICDLWGEWKLTVSWTKSTYVDGQLVKRESGGWSKMGRFVIPGMASTVDRPDGLWKQLGFSNASHGARKIAMQYRLPPGQGPVDLIIHVTRPGGDPVTTVPFGLRMVEGPNGGFTLTKAPDPPCPPESILDDIGDNAPPPESILDDLDQGRPLAPPTPGGQPAIPSAPPPTGGATAVRPKPGGAPVTDVVGLDKEFDDNRLIDEASEARLLKDRVALPAGSGTFGSTVCPDLGAMEQWRQRRDRWVGRLRERLTKLDTLEPTGKFADSIRQAIDAERTRTKDVLRKAEEMSSICPQPDGWGESPPPDTGDEAPESILDDVDESPPVIG